MPKSAPKPCRSPRCASYAGNGGYCDSHKIEAKAESKLGGWGNRESSTARGYGSRWQKIRISVLRRDDYLCQICLISDRLQVANEVDHILPKAKGGNDDIDNLQSLCKECHKLKTISER